MLKPFFQGKLDTFCAIYAVLNALRLTHGIQTLKARDILNETLLSLAEKPGALRAMLEQDTDYMQLVDDMIQARQQRYPLLVEKPFAEGEAVSPDALWDVCRLRNGLRLAYEEFSLRVQGKLVVRLTVGTGCTVLSSNGCSC